MFTIVSNKYVLSNALYCLEIKSQVWKLAWQSMISPWATRIHGIYYNSLQAPLRFFSCELESGICKIYFSSVLKPLPPVNILVQVWQVLSRMYNESIDFPTIHIFKDWLFIFLRRSIFVYHSWRVRDIFLLVFFFQRHVEKTVSRTSIYWSSLQYILACNAFD